MDSFTGKTIISCIDMNSGFWQIDVKKEHRHITAFSTPYGHFEFDRMPFGMCNAVSTFQKMADLLFYGLIGLDCIVYLDDAAIASKDWTSHISTLREVFERFREAGLTIKLSKCKFGMKTINVLGHRIDAEGIHPLQEKMEAIKEMPEHDTVSQVRRFLGMCSYYRRFIPNFAKISGPIADLIKKDVEWRWTKIEKNAFYALIRELTSGRCVAHFDNKLPVTLKVDASRSGLGAILPQGVGDEMKMVASVSRRLSDCESRYPVTELEALGIVFAVQKLRPYLYGKKVTILTDHCALCAINHKRELSRRIAQWAIILSEYDIHIKYVNGSQHVDVDCLSRAPVARSDEIDDKYVYPCLLILPANISDWTRESQEDEEISDMIGKFEAGDPKYKMVNNVLYTRDNKLCVLKSRREEIMRLYHNTQSVAHPGAKATCDIIERNYHWPSLHRDVKDYVSKCDNCLRRKSTTVQSQGLMSSISCERHRTPRGNSHILVAIDVFSRFVEAKATDSNDTKIVARFVVDNLVCRYGTPSTLLSDNGSEFSSHLMTEISNILEIKCLKSAPYHSHGNGMVERVNRTLQEKLALLIDNDEDKWDINLPLAVFAINNSRHSATGYSPFEVVFGRQPRLPVDPLNEQSREEAYTDNLALKLELIRRDAKATDDQYRDNTKDSFDKNRKDVKFNLDDEVLVYFPPRSKASDKLIDRYLGPYQVIEVRENNIYKLKLLDEKIRRKRVIICHVDRMKRYKQDSSLAGNSTPVPAVLAILCCLAVIVDSASADFTSADPIIWSDTNIQHVAGSKTWDLELLIINPCTRMFTNITGVDIMDRTIIDNCNKRFDELVVSEIDKICPNTNQDKRFVFEAGVCVAVATTALVAGDNFFVSTPRLETQTLELKDKTNEIIRSHNQALGEVEQLRTTVIALGKSTLSALQSVQDDLEFLGNITQSQPAVTELVAMTYIKFAKAASLIEASRGKIKQRKIVPYELFDLFNGSSLYDRSLERLSKYENCKRTNVTHLEFRFLTMIKSEDIKVYKADTIDFYNKSSTGEICKCTYAGPEFILFNQTSDCMISLSKTDISDDSIRGVSCSLRGQLTPQDAKWNRIECSDEAVKNRPLRIITAHSHFHYINCQGNSISYNHETKKCPNYIFSSPDTESFNIGDYYYSHVANNLMTKVQLESTAPSRISIQLKTSGLKFIVDDFIGTLANVTTPSKIVEINSTASHWQISDLEKMVRSTQVAEWYKKISDYSSTIANMSYLIFFILVFIVLRPFIGIVVFAFKALGFVWEQTNWTLPTVATSNQKKEALLWTKPLGMRRKDN